MKLLLYTAALLALSPSKLFKSGVRACTSAGLDSAAQYGSDLKNTAADSSGCQRDLLQGYATHDLLCPPGTFVRSIVQARGSAAGVTALVQVTIACSDGTTKFGPVPANATTAVNGTKRFDSRRGFRAVLGTAGCTLGALDWRATPPASPALQGDRFAHICSDNGVVLGVRVGAGSAAINSVRFCCGNPAAPAGNCSRPSGWCVGASTTWTSLDCDGDGYVDQACYGSASGQWGTILSSQGCKNDSWPNGAPEDCVPAFRSSCHEESAASGRIGLTPEQAALKGCSSVWHQEYKEYDLDCPPGAYVVAVNATISEVKAEEATGIIQVNISCSDGTTRLGPVPPSLTAWKKDQPIAFVMKSLEGFTTVVYRGVCSLEQLVLLAASPPLADNSEIARVWKCPGGGQVITNVRIGAGHIVNSVSICCRDRASM